MSNIDNNNNETIQTEGASKDTNVGNQESKSNAAFIQMRKQYDEKLEKLTAEMEKLKAGQTPKLNTEVPQDTKSVKSTETNAASEEIQLLRKDLEAFKTADNKRILKANLKTGLNIDEETFLKIENDLNKNEVKWQDLPSEILEAYVKNNYLDSNSDNYVKVTSSQEQVPNNKADVEYDQAIVQRYNSYVRDMRNVNVKDENILSLEDYKAKQLKLQN